MEKKTPANNGTCPFVTQHAADVIGVLSGFDRLRLRGTLRSLYQPSVLMRYLYLCEVLLKGFKTYALGLTERILGQAQQMANQASRPWVYLGSPRTSKEACARQLAQAKPVTEGRIGILRCVEPGQTYQFRAGRLFLKDARGLHLYFYQQHPLLGFRHLRLPTWFPFQIEICLNGREWLAQQLDRAGVAYERQENYFAWIADLPPAQSLLNQQLPTPWRTHLQGLLDQGHPLHKEICRPLEWEYYWTCCQSEYATDVMFRDPARLAALYPRLVQHALLNFSSRDVLRFLGRKVPLTGKSRCEGEILTDLKARAEGIRIKHRVQRNSLKMYDKFARGLRVETTIDQCEDFQVWRRPEGRADQPKKWRAMRRGLADLDRRAAVSQAANARYLLALAAVDQKTPLRQRAEQLCRPVRRKGVRSRALNPWSPRDGALLQAINRGEFALNGLRNRDLRRLLFATQASVKEERRRAARVSRLLALLRAHGILRKITGTHRYHLTARGRTVVTALLTAREADTQQLAKLAA